MIVSKSIAIARRSARRQASVRAAWLNSTTTTEIAGEALDDPARRPVGRGQVERFARGEEVAEVGRKLRPQLSLRRFNPVAGGQRALSPPARKRELTKDPERRQCPPQRRALDRGQLAAQPADLLLEISLPAQRLAEALPRGIIVHIHRRLLAGRPGLCEVTRGGPPALCDCNRAVQQRRWPPSGTARSTE